MELKITKQAAIEAYSKANQESRELLENLFGKETFQDITERIKTLEDALEELNLNPEVFEDGNADLEDHEIAYRKLTVIVKALNEGWKPDFKNNNEYRYYPWFDINYAGSACAYSYSAPSAAYAIIGSRLLLKSRALALYAGKQFEDIYNEFLTA